MKKPIIRENIKIEKIVGGGQGLGRLTSGKKIFAWNALKDEVVNITLTKKKSSLEEGIVTEIKEPSKDRITPKDPDSYLSTSPWQILDWQKENALKASLIYDSLRLNQVELNQPISMFSDNKPYNYRNKIEFSFFWDKDEDQLFLAFFKRGSHNKIKVGQTSLAKDEINQAAKQILELLRKKKIAGFSLKTLLIRSNQNGEVVAQLYIKDLDALQISEEDFKNLNIRGLEVIYSDPKSPASVITKRIRSFGKTNLEDKILNINFSYSIEGFFQINLPVYEEALKDIKKFIDPAKKTVDLYSGVGTIGLCVSKGDTELVEINKSAVLEMKNNIKKLKLKAKAILASAEDATNYITNNCNLIVDPPRAGLHKNVINKINEVLPDRVIYLSCNPDTQSRDVKLLENNYKIEFIKGYNFFPRTPHIECLIVLKRIN